MNMDITIRGKRINIRANYAMPGLILALSGLSATGLCKGACSALSDFRLFGNDFAVGGAVYAVLILIAVYFAEKNDIFNLVVNLLIAAGIGAELWFIAIQKFIVLKWCPVCLLIATSLFLFAILRIVVAAKTKPTADNTIPRNKWLTIQYGKTPLLFLAIAMGFSTALVSVGRKNVSLSSSAKELDAATVSSTPAEAATESAQAPSFYKKDIWFGDKNSRYEVFFVTDWYCGYCRGMEPAIEKMLPDLGKKARYTWLDLPIHRQSLNIVPYAMNTLLSDKGNYIRARKILYNLTKEGKDVTEMQIRSALEMAGIKAAELPRDMAKNTFLQGVLLCKANGANQTPAAIIIDTGTGARKVLNGSAEITRENLLRAVSEG
jgi:protein-disulfide isomerase